MMAGELCGPVHAVEVREVETEEEAIALALAMCPDGESISLHEVDCAIDDGRCTCLPRVIHKRTTHA